MGIKLRQKCDQRDDKFEVTQARIDEIHILVVRGNLSSQSTIIDWLRLAGVVIVAVSNVQEALEQLAAQKFDLVFIDAQMSMADRFAAIHQIRARKEFAEQTIIAISDQLSLESRDLYLAAGMDDLILDPVDLNAMYQIIAKWLPDKLDLRTGNSKETDKVMAEPASAELPPIDMKVLYQMFHQNTALVHKFGLKFIEVASSTLAEMQVARANRDLSALNHLGHKLKSSAKAIGALSFADLCENLEKTNTINNWADAELLLIKIEVVLAQISQQLKQEFNDENG